MNIIRYIKIEIIFLGMNLPDQKTIENKWQNYWSQNKVFESKSDKNKEKYFATVPYPYANSILHIGHGRTYTAADILIRYQRVKGKNVLFPMAYHISGTPVLAVADGIRKGDEKQIKITRNAISDKVQNIEEQNMLLKSFEDPQNIADFFSGTIEEGLKSIGVGIDWRRQFKTGDKIYNKFIEWQYEKLNEFGLLKQGKYPILYSVEEANAVGEDDIKDGDIEKVSVQEMTYIKFKIKGTEEHLVAATLRPDSLFGATNLYLKPDMELSKIKVDKDIWIVSKNSVKKIKHQFTKVEEISNHLGKELIENTAIVPITNKEIPIYEAAFPDQNHGTGIVYSSPADSPQDYINLFEIKYPGKSLEEFKGSKDPLNLTPITKTYDKKGNEIKYNSDIPAFDTLLRLNIYNSKGNEEKLEIAKQELYKQAHYGAIMINCGEFDNTPVKKGQELTTKKLSELNLGGSFYETTRRAVTRSGNEVIVANLEGQWFLDYTDEEVKDKAYNLLDNMTYFPKQLKETQKGYLKWVSMRPCARRRGLGTPLPYDKSWVIEPLSDSTIYPMLYLVAHIIHSEELEPDCLTPDLFDYLFLSKGNINLISENTKISKEIIEEMRSEVDYWKGFDLRYTAAAHMSNHLSFLIYHYSLIFPKDYHPINVTVGGMLIKDGHKISKSKGNGIPLHRIKTSYGADLYRLYIAVASNIETEMDFRDDEIRQLEKKFNKFKELMSKAKTQYIKPYDTFIEIDKWLISKFYSKVDKYFSNMEEKRIREAYIEILYEFLNDINYHTRRTSEEQTSSVLKFLFEDYLTLMTPVIPHVCEELYEGESDKCVSLSEYSTDSSKFIDREIESREEIIENVISNISRTKETKKIDEIFNIKIVQASNLKFDLFNKLGKMLSENKQPKEIFSELSSEFPEENKFVKKFVPKTLGEGLSYYLEKDKEKILLESIKDFLKSEFNVQNIEIVDSDNLTDINKTNILPSKPLILIE